MVKKTTDVLKIDSDHVTPITREMLRFYGMKVEERSFYGQPNDSLFAWKIT